MNKKGHQKFRGIKKFLLRKS